MRLNDVIADGNPNSGFELRMFRWQFIYRLQRLDFRKWRCLMGKFELFFWLVFTWLECVFITKHCFFMVIVICGVLKRFRMSPTLCRWYSFSSRVGTSAEWFWLLLINCVGGIFDPPPIPSSQWWHHRRWFDAVVIGTYFYVELSRGDPNSSLFWR